jgi:hypothetical protein
MRYGWTLILGALWVAPAHAGDHPTPRASLLMVLERCAEQDEPSPQCTEAIEMYRAREARMNGCDWLPLSFALQPAVHCVDWCEMVRAGVIVAEECEEGGW